MTGGGADQHDDADGAYDAAAVRPFLARAPKPVADGDAVVRSRPFGSDGVRPYYLTRGRVASADGRVRVETVVVARPNAAFRLRGPEWEQRRLLALAERPTSVVELAVALAVPIGVVLVLVGDLAGDGLLDISVPAVAPHHDIALIRRLIDHVGAL